MTELIPNSLYTGSQDDEAAIRHEAGWAVVHCAKEPYHRAAVGYRGRSCDKSHPEYLVARRGDRLALNLVDVDDPTYVSADVIRPALAFIHEQRQAGRKVLVHCNQGLSRGPTVAMMYLGSREMLPSLFDAALEQFKAAYYPRHSPAGGIIGFARANWSAIVSGEL